MKILVPVKRVPDPYGKVTVDARGEVDETDLKWVVNPFDEIALEEAVRMRESGASIEIVAVSVGAAETETILRTTLAMGADRALLILDDDTADPRWVTALLHAAAVRERPDLILMGKQAIDDDNSQVGPRLAAKLDCPQATFASKITVSDDFRRARVTREVDAGQETLDVALPAVITTDLRLNEPRYVALPAILKARSKPLEKLNGADLAARPQARMRIVSRAMPPERKAGRKVGSVAELVDALRTEARVI